MHRAARQALRVQARLLHSTSRASLPRITPRSRVAVEASEDESLQSTTTSDAVLPWFLELEAIQLPSAVIPTSSVLPLVSDTSQHLVPALAELRSLILTSSLARLLASTEHGVEPLRFIHARNVDPEGAWCDWIVIVEVQGSAAGAVASLAKLCGEHLKHAVPPRNATDEALDLLGAPLPPRVKLSSSSNSTPPQRPQGMPRASFEVGKSLEPWRVQKEATASKGPWRPRRIISREAQVGMRLLASSDASWDAARLAQHFKISPEAARRILRSKWQAPGSVVGRQNRRAAEREREYKLGGRQEEEMRAIWRELGEQPKQQHENHASTATADEVEEHEELEGEEEHYELSSSPSSTGYTQAVHYEGLVGPATSDTPVPRKGTPASRGDGEWCVVDAEWCVVHVMTTRARATYDVESRWSVGNSKRTDDGARSMTGRNRPRVPKRAGSKNRYAIREGEA